MQKSAARFNHAFIHGPRSLTDIYLLGLVVKNAGRLVTFDQRIALTAVYGAMVQHLLVLQADRAVLL